jgi:hypothetical protein
MGNIAAIVHITKILSIIILCGAVGLIILKLRNLRLEKLMLQYSLKHQEYLDYVAANLDDQLPLNPPYGRLSPLERKIIRQKLFAWMRQIRGEQRMRIAELCQQMGFVEEEKARLNSRFRWIQVDAAHNLGVMRSKDACQLLINLQADETFGATLFILTRAIARCARNIDDIRDMVQIVVMHGKACSELMADILVEVTIDYSSLLKEWLQSEEEDHVHIALLCLHGQPELNVEEHLVKLSQSNHKEIRIKAVKVWLGQSGLPTSASIIAFLGHSDWEIRAQAAKAAGTSGSSLFLEPLRNTVQDNFWWVRYYSARSLMRIEGSMEENIPQPLNEVNV